MKNVVEQVIERLNRGRCDRTAPQRSFGSLLILILLCLAASCLNRLNYDLEAQCRDVSQRRKGIEPRAGRNGGESIGAQGCAGKGQNSAGAASRILAATDRNSPNYTAEGVITDIYGGATTQNSTGTRERNTRSSRKTASSVWALRLEMTFLFQLVTRVRWAENMTCFTLMTHSTFRKRVALLSKPQRRGRIELILWTTPSPRSNTFVVYSCSSRMWKILYRMGDSSNWGIMVSSSCRVLR